MRFPIGLMAGLVSSCALAAITVAARAQPLNNVFTYQGELRTSGSPASGLHDLRFRLYDAAVGGAPVGSTLCSNNVSMSSGRFTVDLDFGAVFAGQQRFLEIQVRADTGLDCATTSGFTQLGPRQPLNAAPNAVFALNATTATNTTQLNGQGASFYQNAANLSSGTIPSARLSGAYSGPLTLSNAANVFTGAGAGLTGVNADLLDGLNSTAFLQSIPNPLTLSGTSATHIIRGENASTATGSKGVHGLATAAAGETYGVYGESASTDGRAVFGLATATTGSTYGGLFGSASTSGRAVYGVATAGTGGTNGGEFWSASTSGRGVAGLAYAASGDTYGVWGQSDSTGGRGVFGFATATTGPTYGVYGHSASTNGRGVFGKATSTTNFAYGVSGQSDSTSGRGVFGYTNATTGSTYGVIGASTSESGYAVYALGSIGATGSKSFRIDHPDDPANKYLLHYSTESPEVLNAYSGTITLDGAGQAVVELPHYFAKINKDPRYTLTAVGAPMPMLHVAAEIDEAALSAGARSEPGEAAPLSSFRIAGGASGAKVSWEVKALRNDRWVQKRGAPVEVEKQGPEKGTYQHPDLYGQPPEKGMDYDATRRHPEPALPEPIAAAPR